MNDYSVLMSVYAKEKPEYFDFALESINHQTFLSNDIVIVCDGPLTPELEEVLRLRKNDRYSIVRLEKNSGLGVALNAGLSVCKNEIVLRADSDDYSLPDRAEKEIQFLVENNLDLAGSYIVEFEESVERLSSVRKVPTDQKSIDRFIKTRSPFNHPSVIFRKSAIMEVGGYLDFPFFEDYFLWSRVVAEKKFRYANIDESLVYMRTGSKNELIKRRLDKAAVESSFKIIMKNKELGIINGFECFFVLLFRKTFNVLPFSLKKWIYQKVLRTRI